MMTNENTLQYPIGRFEWKTQLSAEERKRALETLASFPAKLEEFMQGFPASLLSKRYRPEGWNVIQLIHHLADSHLHSFMRCKHALLEDTPKIKDYQEKDWANTTDASQADVAISISLLKALHQRWVIFFKSLTEEEFQRAYFHPERHKNYPLDTVLALYAWHGEHHLAHLKLVLENPYD